MATIPSNPVTGTTISTSGFGVPVVAALTDHESRITIAEANQITDTGRTITGSNGITGGGNLTANRVLSPVYGTTANTITQGNDARVTITQDATKGNTALDSRVAVLESAPTNVIAGGEFRANASQTFAAAGATKITFGSTVQAATNITWAGNNTFTVTVAGVYSISVIGARGYNVNNNWSVCAHRTTAPGSLDTWLSPPFFPAGATDSFSSAVKYFAVGDTLSAYIYNNETGSFTLNPASTRPLEIRFWKVA